VNIVVTSSADLVYTSVRLLDKRHALAPYARTTALSHFQINKLIEKLEAYKCIVLTRERGARGRGSK